MPPTSTFGIVTTSSIYTPFALVSDGSMTVVYVMSVSSLLTQLSFVVQSTQVVLPVMTTSPPIMF